MELHYLLASLIVTLFLTNCATLPNPEHKTYSFPRDSAFLGNKSSDYQTLGVVRSKVNFQTLDPVREEIDLCRNYYNKSVQELVQYAKQKGGDAVIEVKSVVFLENGKFEFYSTPECSDDGMEGQILTQGIAIRWKNKELNQKP